MVAQRARCQYLEDSNHFIVPFLNTEYKVSLSNREIVAISQRPTRPAEFLEQLCILAYLINAQDLPPANKLVQAESLSGGQFFFRGLHCLPTKKLEETFGDCPEVLYGAARRFGAKKCEFGDASVCFYMLPRVPLTIVLWKKDEEFDARASILFDQTASSQLPLDALLAAVNLSVEALISKAGGQN